LGRLPSAANISEAISKGEACMSISSLATFPGQLENNTSMTQFCRIEVVGVDLSDEDSDITIEDIQSPSMFGRYHSPVKEDMAYADDEGGVSCVALTFYTESGEVCRYITDSQCDDIYEVFAQVLAALGQQGWQAINLVVDRDNEETWFLQRIVGR
jgi:hypothetical protein